MFLGAEDATTLLDLARRTLLSIVHGRPLPDLRPPSPSLSEPRGAFVTLYRLEELRGCIGSILPSGPLWEIVRTMTVSSATRDPRFAPIRAREVDAVDIHVSVLSPLARVGDVAEIEVGRHGLCVKARGRTGVLLPSVGTRYGWTRERFYAETLRKAGLEAHRRFEDTEVAVFEVQELIDRQS